MKEKDRDKGKGKGKDYLKKNREGYTKKTDLTTTWQTSSTNRLLTRVLHTSETKWVSAKKILEAQVEKIVSDNKKSKNLQVSVEMIEDFPLIDKKETHPIQISSQIKKTKKKLQDLTILGKVL